MVSPTRCYPPNAELLQEQYKRFTVMQDDAGYLTFPGFHYSIRALALIHDPIHCDHRSRNLFCRSDRHTEGVVPRSGNSLSPTVLYRCPLVWTTDWL